MKRGDVMAQTETSRRAFIGSAALLGPVALLSGCGSGGGASAQSAISSLFGASTVASGQTETQIWQAAIGQTFRIRSAAGPIFASLTSVTAQPLFGERPDMLRQAPLLLSFTLDAGYDTTGDDLYFLDRTMGTESRLFMQRGTTATGRPELLALLN